VVLFYLFALHLHVESKRVNRFVHDALCLVNALVQASVDLLSLLVVGLAVVVDHDFDGVLEAQLDQTLGDWRGVIHRWGTVHFDEPAIKVLVNHDIVPKELVRLALLGVKGVLDRLETVDHYVFNLLGEVLFPNVISVFFVQVILKVLQAPHVALYLVLSLALSAFGD
jgi:hypothetical protein